MKNISTKECIASLDFFDILEQKELDLLSDISTITSFDASYVLYYEKKRGDKLYFLLDGMAKAYKIDKHNNEIFLHYIYKNSIISDISSLDEDYLYAFSNIIFLEPSTVLSIDYKKFKENFLEHKTILHRFTQQIINRSLMLQDLINREFIFNSIAKVAMMISSDLDMFNTLKRADISLMLNIQPETLSRVLNRLKRDAIIDIINGKIFIQNSVMLKKLYEE